MPQRRSPNYCTLLLAASFVVTFGCSTPDPDTDAPAQDPNTDAPEQDPDTDAPEQDPDTDAPEQDPDADAPEQDPDTPADGGTSPASPPQSCGGLLGGVCGDGEFCSDEPAVGGQGCDNPNPIADFPGVCQPKPEACLAVVDPVCGCDKKTYSNACEAHAAGISIARPAECEKPPAPVKTCGGLLGGVCGDGEFCSVERAVGGPGCDNAILERPGVCQPKPEVCSFIYMPVCGCDNKTYASACVAHAAGISIARPGECEKPPAPVKTCGGLLGGVCGDGEFCSVERAVGGPGCDNAILDRPGVCQPKPKACNRKYEPVCGCDRRSYASPCDAHAHGASVMHAGLCTAEECREAGGRPQYSNGASIPRCKAGEQSFAIPGREPAVCCVPGGKDGLAWYETCGAPVCGGPQTSTLPKCQDQTGGASCSKEGAACDLGNQCGTHLICAKSDPKQGPGGCPISRAGAKMNIHYLDSSELAQKHDEIIGLSIAQYTYKDDANQQSRLGFIIEDVEPSAFVDEARDRVDLYAYTSAVVAAVKVQEQRILGLEAQIKALRRQVRSRR